MNIPDTTNWTIKQCIDWLKQCTPAQWDAICKGCGVCCLKKFYNPLLRPNNVFYTNCACPNLDTSTRRCKIYNTRLNGTAHCMKITIDTILHDNVLPSSCGYVEFIYGPSANPAHVNWHNVFNTPDDTPDETKQMLNNTIIESFKWNLRQR